MLNEQILKNIELLKVSRDWVRKEGCVHQARVCDALPLCSLVSQWPLRGDTRDSGKQPDKLWSRVQWWQTGVCYWCPRKGVSLRDKRNHGAGSQTRMRSMGIICNFWDWWGAGGGVCKTGSRNYCKGLSCASPSRTLFHMSICFLSPTSLLYLKYFLKVRNEKASWPSAPKGFWCLLSTASPKACWLLPSFPASQGGRRQWNLSEKLLSGRDTSRGPQAEAAPWPFFAFIGIHSF